MQIRDLLPGCVLGVTAYVQGETKDAELLGSAVMSMFSKKGRLKTSLQRLCLCPGMQPDLRWPSRTPGKAPMAERGRMGELEQKLKQFERLDMPYMPRCSWLDGKTLSAIKDLQTSLAPVRLHASSRRDCDSSAPLSPLGNPRMVHQQSAVSNAQVSAA